MDAGRAFRGPGRHQVPAANGVDTGGRMARPATSNAHAISSAIWYSKWYEAQNRSGRQNRPSKAYPRAAAPAAGVQSEPGRMPRRDSLTAGPPAAGTGGR